MLIRPLPPLAAYNHKTTGDYIIIKVNEQRTRSGPILQNAIESRSINDLFG